MSGPKKDTKKTTSDIVREGKEGNQLPLTLQHGTQYLCQARLDVAGGQPGILQALQGVPHLHLRVDVALTPLVPEKRLYEVRLTLQGEGTVAGPNGQQQAVYSAVVSYGGLFALEGGEGTPEERTRLLSEEGPAALFHGARSVLLNLIRDAGFPVGAPQPIDFRHFWKQKNDTIARTQATPQATPQKGN